MHEDNMRLQREQMGLQAASMFNEGFDREQMRDVLSYTLDNDRVLEQFEKQLRGLQLDEVFDEDQKEWVRKWVRSGDPFMLKFVCAQDCGVLEPEHRKQCPYCDGEVIDMGSRGITDYIAFISGYIGKNAIFSAFPTEMALTIFLRGVGHSIANWCENNHTRYGIDPLKARPVINRTIDLIQLSVQRSLMGQERKFGYGAVPTQVQYGTGEPAKSRAWFS